MGLYLPVIADIGRLAKSSDSMLLTSAAADGLSGGGLLPPQGGEDRRDDARKRRGFGRRTHAIQSQATILRAVIISFVAVAKDLKWLVCRCA
jgi:hypothetical protein